MKTLLEILGEKFGSAFQECGYDFDAGVVFISSRPELCEFQCNGALKLAKKFHKAPIMIANEVVGKLQGSDEFESLEAVAPGFINIKLSKSFVCSYIEETLNDKYYGMPQILNGKKIIIDYGGPNVAKPLHVGHLRSAIIGEAIKRIAKACGGDAVGENHLGNWGLPMGLVILGIKERYPNLICFKGNFSGTDEEIETLKKEMSKITNDELNEIYPLASMKSKEDKDFSKEAHEITYHLQKKEPRYYILWKIFNEISNNDIKRLFDILNVDIEYWKGESFAEDYVDELIRVLEKENLLVESDGAKVVHVEKEGDTAPMPPVIIKKSDGSNIYATTDLATIIRRKKEFNPDAIWYLADNRQGLHFEQVFRCAKLSGIAGDDLNLEFFGFGTMNGNDGKPYKTRDGGVMKLDDLLQNAYQKSYDVLGKREFDSEEEKKETAWRIAIASIKFGDLYNNRAKDYIFDLDKFLSSEGKTGVYLLYTVTRINSILAKYESAVNKTMHINAEILNDNEKSLLLCIALLSDIVYKSILERLPHYLCELAYYIASRFSSFYHDCPILAEKNEKLKENRIAICKITKAKMEFLLDLLAIKTVRMM